MTDTESAPPEVGFAKPPAASRFAKGRSGNPRGRPKGSRNKQAPYETVLGQKVTVRTDDTTRRVSAAEAFLLHMIKRGLEGDVSAARAMLDALEAQSGSAGGGRRPDMATIIRSIRGTAPRDWVTHLACDLKIATLFDRFRETARSALEPWVVEAAIARLGVRRLELAEQQTVWSGTRTPWKVAWPDWWTFRG